MITKTQSRQVTILPAGRNACLHVASLFAFAALNLHGTETIPSAVADQYASSANTSISDEFNQPALDTTKWAYRTMDEGWGTGPDYVSLETEGEDHFVAIHGRWKERKGSGIVTKTEAHFGFYSIRWRTAGINLKQPTPWHPAIWMCDQNFATGSDHRVIAQNRQFVEIDFMECWFQPSWHSATIAWDRTGAGPEKKINQKLRPPMPDVPTRETGWQEHGLEYTPDYLQLWQKINDHWQPIGSKIPITGEPNSPAALNRVFATPGYWILSNKDTFENVKKKNAKSKNAPDFSSFLFEDSSLDVDYFRYFPLKQTP